MLYLACIYGFSLLKDSVHLKHSSYVKVRFINFERTKLPEEILRHNLEEKRKYYADISIEVEKSDAEVQVNITDSTPSLPTTHIHTKFSLSLCFPCELRIRVIY